FSISFALNDYLRYIILFQLILAFLTYSIFLYEKKKEDFSLIKYILISFFIMDYLLSFSTSYYLLNCRKDILQLMYNSNIFQNVIIIIIQILSLSVMLYFQNRLSFLVNKSAEINAKFTLDTLPIASMAIDADFNSGSIDLEEANIKRNELRTVSSFLDNMDNIGKLINYKISANILFCVFYLLLGTFIGIYVNNEPIVKALNISFGSSLIFTLYFIVTSGFISFINRNSINNELKLIPNTNINYENEDNTHDKIRKLGYNILKNYVLKQNDYFSKSDILRDCPSLESLSLYSLIRELKREGIIVEIMYRNKED
ncbi:MAG: FHIPEP family type III secretion protein, partial [Candidatus Riflebacteria bacterium]|nr:FHIPEP family type III secretion protein [Candidatus Riflebacteria bacterium]